MKDTPVVVIGLLFVTVAVLARRPDPVLTPYPVVFSAVYNESDLAFTVQPPRMNTVFLDLPNKRASVNYASSNGQTQTWTLIYQPQGADPTAPASQGYTMFNINPDYPENVPNNCMYMTGDPMSLAPFPPHWSDSISYYKEVSTWMDLPSDLEYAGPYFIAELGVTADRWDTVSQCILEKTGIGQVPCTSVMFSQGPNPVPLMDIRAFGARKNSFQNDEYLIRVYHSFKTSVQASNFALPNNWESQCGNADNGFVTQPDFAIMVYSATGPDSNLKIKLASPPIESLGDVNVYLTASPTWYFNCTDCLLFGADVLTFTHQNWNTTQTWPIKFNHNGCSQYIVSATGGGYDWTYYKKTITFYGCQGDNFDGCIGSQPVCGN